VGLFICVIPGDARRYWGILVRDSLLMGLLELIFIAVGLSMDAFAVAVSRGLCLREHQWRNALVTGVYFGVFQAIMPLVGYFIGRQFKDAITSWDHWIAFALLLIIGLNMIRESRRGDGDGEPAYGFKKMVLLSLATSIDALAVGVTFGFLQVNIVPAVLLIGLITLVISAAGVKIGCVFGSRFKSKAEIAGGVILILIGVKILLEHLGVIHF
jgi:putative Mn2+ efflux pump MntP